MALPDLTGFNIEDTYQRVLHTDGISLWDGTGSLVTLQYTGSFTGDGSGLTGITATATPAAPDQSIQFNNNGVLGGNSGLTYNYISQSLQQGNNAVASGRYSHAEGNNPTALGYGSHAEGRATIAIGESSHAEGISSTTGTVFAYLSSASLGIITLDTTYGDASTVFVADTYVLLYDSFIGGGSIYFKISRKVSQSYYDNINSVTVVELYDTTISTNPVYIWNGSSFGDETIPGNYSHAEGNSTIAVGDQSHAEGYATQTIGPHSHAEGNGSLAIGEYSHAEGDITQAVGLSSHAEGYGTIALGDRQHVQGRFNTPSSEESAFIVGNGKDTNNRSNLVFASGNQFQITGSLLVSGSIDGIINGGTF